MKSKEHASPRGLHDVKFRGAPAGRDGKRDEVTESILTGSP
jgi:hypothetical protein